MVPARRSATVETRAAKDALFDALASVARALSSGRRAEIVELLAQGERTVEQIAAAIGQSVANTSHHLRALAAAGLVVGRRQGTYVHYRLASERALAAWLAVRDVASEQLDQIERLAHGYLGGRDDLEQIDRDELLDRLDRGDVTLIDVRPEDEYRAGHLPGAVSVPLERLDDLADQLPDGPTIVAYCRGRYCVFADEAVRRLRERGRAAQRLSDGVVEWRHAGHPLHT